MMKKILTTAIVALLISSPAFAQEKEEDPGYYGSITINSDSFFGLTPIAAVGIPLTDTIDLTGYAIFWSGIGNGTGSFGHWTEFGGGVNFNLMDGALSINPQLGVLNGSLLSRGAFGSGTGNAMFGEGYVPNIVILFEQGGFELELYGGYYMGARTQTGAKTTPLGVTEHGAVDPAIATISATSEGAAALSQLGLKKEFFPNDNYNLNYTHFWAFPGYQFTDWLSAGAHWEELRVKPTGGQFDYNSTVYSWTGLYVTLKAGKGSLRVAGGMSRTNTSSGPGTAAIVAGLTADQATRDKAVETYLTTATAPGDMAGTYYRVTYTQEF